MASISVDEIYSTVRSLANKSSSTFSPAEFNRVAQLVNMDIFKSKKKDYAANSAISEGIHHLITTDDPLTLTAV